MEAAPTSCERALIVTQFHAGFGADNRNHAQSPTAQKVVKIILFTVMLFVALIGVVEVTQKRGTTEVHPVQKTGAMSSALISPIMSANHSNTVSTTMISPATFVAESHFIYGRVIGLAGEPISGASISTEEGATQTGVDGQFKLVVPDQSPRWLTATHPSYLSRTRAAAPDTTSLLRLTPDDGETVSLHFVGDTMFGRRFYDPNEDGNPNDGLLRIGDGPQEHLALLRGIQPLLQNAHLTVVNLESSLSASPYIDPTGPRPTAYHPTKDYIFSTHVSAASALRQAGVDMIDTANNHLYDGLDQGVITTLNTLADAGFAPGVGYFGAGLTEAEAWRPAVISQRGQSIAFLGCTTITYPFVDGVPVREAVSYFASDDKNKGGAARCTEEGIREAVTAAVNQYDVVVFMVHGGSEYERKPTDVLIHMSNVARAAGAQLIIDHQTHVVSGLNWDGSSLLAWSLGNFLFDQTVWSTFETYLLAVHVRRGEVIRAYVEPLLIEGYLPKGVTGGLADYVARGAAGRASGPFVLENGAMEVDIPATATREEVALPLQSESAVGNIYKLNDDWWVSNYSGAGRIQLGRDLLWVGSFEDEDVDTEQPEQLLWNLDPPDKYIGSAYAFTGNAGVRLQRGARSSTDVILMPIHRIAVQPETELSVVGRVRATMVANLEIQLSWYPDTSGPSTTQTVQPILIDSDNRWQAFRFDLNVPADCVAVGLFLRLSPPLTTLVTADLDDIRMIEWSTEAAPYGPLHDYVRVFGAGDLMLGRDILPGGEPSATLPVLTAVE